MIASADQVDITDLARARLDAALGEGVAFRPTPRPVGPDAAPPASVD